MSDASNISFLSLPQGDKLAYALTEGNSPTVVFCGGFKSDMTGSKAMALEAHCKAVGRRFIRFDYTGHGQSSGTFTDGTISNWLSDALTIINALAGERILLVGSSMGAWISLLAARQLSHKLVGLVGVASAPDFTERLIWQQFTPEQQTYLLEQGVLHIPSCYGQEPYAITRALIEDGRNNLLLDAPIAISAPVRLLHGTHDEDVPWQISIALQEKLTAADVQLTLIKGGNHRLSEPSQLALICQAVEDIFSLPAL